MRERSAKSHCAALTIFGLFGTVLLFGAITMVVGVRQAMTGTRSRPLLYLQWATGALILIMAFLTVSAFIASRGSRTGPWCRPMATRRSTRNASPGLQAEERLPHHIQAVGHALHVARTFRGGTREIDTHELA